MNKSIRYCCPDGHIQCDINLGKCPVCGKDMLSSKPKDWLDRLLEDRELWHDNAYTKYPSIIAYEYNRVREMTEQKQAYGIPLVIKDLMESVLKFYILSICGWANASEDEVFKKKVLPNITIPNLSLGSWHALGVKIAGYYSKTEKNLPRQLQAGLDIVLNFYQKRRFVNWRNEKIAHGALALSTDEEYQKDIKEKLGEFKNLFEQLDKGISDIKLRFGDLELNGYSNARNIKANSDSNVEVQILNSRFSVDPFIIINEGDVYFFDTQKNRRLSRLQSYPAGRKLNKQIAYFSELSSMLGQDIIRADTVINEKYRSISDDIALDQIGIETDFMEPDFLTKWVREIFKNYSGGVFSLEMSRGMGKSTFAERINTLRNKPIIIASDLDIRTYHINRSQLIGTEDFEFAIETQWAAEFNGNYRIRAPRIADFWQDCNASPSKALIGFLNDYLQYTKTKRDKQRIALVIDGLDEIADEAIWKYIPTKKEIPEGIYVILTYRSPDEDSLSISTTLRLNKLDCTAGLMVTPNSNEYDEFLREYISSFVHVSESDYQTEMIRAANHRILYLNMICKLLDTGYSLERILKSDSIVSCYFDQIKSQYGEEAYVRFLSMVSLFCEYGNTESMSIRDISYSMYDGRITYDLLGRLSDFMPFLDVERGFFSDSNLYGFENRYRIANPDLVASLKCFLNKKCIDNISVIELALSDALEAKFDVKDQYLTFVPNNLVIFDRMPEIEKAFGKIPDNMYFNLAEENESGDIILQYDVNESILLFLSHIGKNISQNVKSYILNNLYGIVDFLVHVSWSDRMIVIDFTRKCCDQLLTIIEQNDVIKDRLDLYFELIKIGSKACLRAMRTRDAIKFYIRFLESFQVLKVENVSLSGDYQIQSMIELAEIYQFGNRNDYAIKLFNGALDLFRKERTEDIIVETRIKNGLIKAYHQIGDTVNALAYTRDLLYIVEQRIIKKTEENSQEFFYGLYTTLALSLRTLEKDESGQMSANILYNIALNGITQLFRCGKLRSYTSLINIYFAAAKEHSLPRKDGTDYRDWALIYYKQIVDIYDYILDHGEQIDVYRYIEAIDGVITLNKELGIKANRIYLKRIEANKMRQRIERAFTL